MSATIGDTDRARIANVRRRWPRYRWDHQGQSRWEGWGADRYIGLGIAAALALATFLEVALLGNQGHFGLSRPAGVMLLLMTVVNAWILTEWISSHTPGDRNLSAWLRLLRPLVVGVPVLGLAAVPAWKWIATARPAWAFRHAQTEPCLNASRLASTHGLPRWPTLARRLVWTHGQRLSGLLAWMIACQIFPFLGGMSWLIGSGPLGPLHRNVLLLACAALHLLAALFGRFYGRRQVDPTALRLRALPWLLLLPGLGILSLAILHPTSFHRREEGLLVQTVCDRRRVERMPGDLLEAPLGGVGDAELHRRALFRLKTLLLALDAAALSWLTTRFLGWSPGFALTRSWMAIGLLLLSVLSGLLLGILGLAARWRRGSPALLELSRLAMGRYLVFVPIAFSSGFVLGSLLAQGDTSTAGTFLFLAGFAALLLHVVWTPLTGLFDPGARADSTVIFWFLLWAGIEILGAALQSGSETSRLRMLERALLLAPVLNLALFTALGGWLLRPFTLRHLLDARLPFRKRMILGLTAFTAALPLGGAAIPFWIYAHHRSWPRLERAWANGRP